jgi:acetyltransferase-like isoleucine patch superfamily enzyme
MPSGSITIGDNTGISNSVIVSWQKIEIGDNVLIGADCKIYDTDFHSTVFSDRLSKEKMKAKTASVKICNGVFVGTGTIILKGVTIGSKSIIAAGAVVVKSIPSGEIWGGNPAKFIRKLTSKELQ